MPDTVPVVHVQRLAVGQLERELAKVEQRREPPMPVWAWLHLDGADVPGVLHGWSANPNGADDGLRGLVVADREYAPGFLAEWIGWVPAEKVRRRDG